MPSRWIALATLALLASREAEAACVIHGARPTVPLPTMVSGQEFSFIASPDCETLRFTIRGTDVSKIPRSGEQVGPGPMTYKVNLTESEWDAVVAESGPALTWIVTGRTSAGVTTRIVTTNDLNADETIAVDLSRADAKLVNEERFDYAGVSVSGAGDVDGDGHDDLLVGGSRTAYLVSGPVLGSVDLSMADAELLGGLGLLDPVVSGAGDVDADGHDDLLVGAPGGGASYNGVAYLVLGPVTGTVDLSLAADAELLGEASYDRTGTSVSDAGDVDGDGHADVLIGSRYHSEGPTRQGAAYLVLGPVTGTLDLSFADAKLVGERKGDQAGSVAGAGDVDGDGLDDVLVGAYSNDEGAHRAGAAFLVLGPVTGTLDLSLADATLVGEDEGDGTGFSLSGAGDVDGDGQDDMLVGAFGRDEGGGGAGAAYLVLGSVTGTRDLSSADATLVGERFHDYAGNSVSGAGDVDLDGHDDLLVGTVSAGPSPPAYLVLGPVTGTLALSLADAQFVGERPDDWADISVSGAGDVDGDGRNDVLIGAPHARGPGDSTLGAAYLIYGGVL